MIVMEMMGGENDENRDNAEKGDDGRKSNGVDEVQILSADVKMIRNDDG